MLSRRWQGQNDEAALTELVTAHLPLVTQVARKFLASRWTRDELFQQGAVGLMEAAARWRPRRGIRFGAYARCWIDGEIRQFVNMNSRMVRPPTTPDDRKRWYAETKEFWADAPLHAGTDTTLIDTIADDRPSPEAIAIDRQVKRRVVDGIHAAMTGLSDRERVVIRARYFANPPVKLKALAVELGVSTARVGAIEKSAIKKLKNHPGLLKSESSSSNS